MALIERLGPAGAVVVGILLVNYEMQAPALADILHARVSLVAALAALAVFIAIAASTPAAPVVLSVAAPDRVVRSVCSSSMARPATGRAGIAIWLIRVCANAPP